MKRYYSIQTVTDLAEPSHQLKHHAWTKGPDGIVYLVNNQKLAWEDAKQFCEKRSGKLAIITNGHVRDSLKDLLRNQERGLYWSGNDRICLIYVCKFSKKGEVIILVLHQCKIVNNHVMLCESTVERKLFTQGIALDSKVTSARFL